MKKLHLCCVLLLSAMIGEAPLSYQAAPGYGQQYGQSYGQSYGQPYSQPYNQPGYGQMAPGAQGYGQQNPYNQHGFFHQFNPYKRPCSRQRAQMKYQKNLMEYQQRLGMCRQGDQNACGKSQGDLESMRKYAHIMQNCPNP
jgi:hypothetical protein